MMIVLLSALAFMVLLTLLILIHELGHFAVARLCGVTVEEFGFGLPPRAKGLFTRSGTLFSLNWIPFGGFVRLKGENSMDGSERTQRGSFAAASVVSRILILVAGVCMNFVLALIILTIGFSIGRWVPTYLTDEAMQAAADRGEISMKLHVLIDRVVAGGGAATAGVPERSILHSIDGKEVTKPQQVSVLQEGKRAVTYRLLTGEAFAEEKTIRVSLVEGKSGVAVAAYPLDLSAPRRSLVAATMLAFRESWVRTQQAVVGIAHLVRSLLPLCPSGATHLFCRPFIPEGIVGIIGIAQITHASVREGFMAYLYLVAILSLSLAVFNILPFPALDGGRVLFVLVECVIRRPLNRRVEVYTNAVGFVFLISLILLITFHDIVRLFS